MSDDYHTDISAASSTMLKTLARSPRIFEATYITKTLRYESAAMQLGTAIHCAAIEGSAQFEKRYIVRPPEYKTTKSQKYAEWRKTIDPHVCDISQTDCETVKRCVDAILEHPIGAQLLEAAGPVEQIYTWNDYGVDCKFKPDKVVPAWPAVVDLKTTKSADEGAFAKQFCDFRYDIQATHYLSGARDCFNMPSDLDFFFVVVETNVPYRCRVWQIDDRAAEIGELSRYQLLREFKQRKESGDWSDPGENVAQCLTLPPYWYRKHE